jgi:hypothetical protein
VSVKKRNAPRVAPATVLDAPALNPPLHALLTFGLPSSHHASPDLADLDAPAVVSHSAVLELTFLLTANLVSHLDGAHISTTAVPAQNEAVSLDPPNWDKRTGK